jgi:autophagy-related protein 18
LLFDTVKLEAINVVEAHRSPLSCMVLNIEGTILATASDKGTIIRVFSVPEAHKMYQFRRGSMPCRIFNMSLNITSTLLCVSSATDTIHIFKLGPQSSPPPESSSSPGKLDGFFHNRRWSETSESPVEPSDELDESGMPSSAGARRPNGTLMGLIRRTSQNVGSSLATVVGGYLPKGVTEMWEPTRDFAWIKIPKANTPPASGSLRSVVAMSSTTPQVMVVTSEGNFFVFNIDLVKGGEGTLIKQYSYVNLVPHLWSLPYHLSRLLDTNDRTWS